MGSSCRCHGPNDQGKNGDLSSAARQSAARATAKLTFKPDHSVGVGHVLLGGVPGVERARMLIIGGGVVGTHAARMAVGLGADVTILDRSLPRLRELDQL